MTSSPRGQTANTLHIDDASFHLTPEREKAYADLMKKGNSDTINEKVSEFQQMDHGQFLDDFDLFDYPPSTETEGESVFGSDEKFNDYVEDLVATKGKTPMQQNHDIVITSEQVAQLKESVESPTHTLEGNQSVEQLDQTFENVANQGRGYSDCITRVEESPFIPGDMKEPNQETEEALESDPEPETYSSAKEMFADIIGVQPESECADDETFTLPVDEEPKVVTLGAGAGKGSLAFAQALATRKEKTEVQMETVKEALKTESNSQRKKRLAEEHNAKINGNKVAVVKFRSFGLSIQLEILELSNRAVNMSKERGEFAVYTTKSAVAASALNQLPAHQHYNRTTISAITLDWLLDQIGEDAAFEVRSGRLRPSTPLKYTITKTEAEWLAKGFFINNGTVRFGGHWESQNH